MKIDLRLGLKFKDEGLLQEALTHRSYLNENKKSHLISNERLEFLGDAILSLIVSHFLYQKFSSFPEGDLTNLRASLVKTKTLAMVAQKLGLGDYLLLSKGEEEGGGRKNQGILADTFEAVIGALFLDSGLVITTDFVKRHLLPLLPEIIEKEAFRDYKSLLQEKVQREKKVAPVYRVLKTTGPDHKRIFTIGVYVTKEEAGRGSGYSKQEAEQEAAKAALEKLDQIK